MKTDYQEICIFQPYYHISQEHLVDPAFLPLNNIENPYPEQREYFLFKKLFASIDTINADYIGLFSLRFHQKSLLCGADVMRHIKNNSGYDVYLFNPYPQEDFIFYNIWEHGEYYHPGITSITQDALNKVHPTLQIASLTRPQSNTLFCNFWVANKLFWKQYIDFLMPVAEIMISQPEKYFVNTRYKFGPQPFFPFIVERLFSAYLMWRGGIRYLAYQYPEPYFAQLAIHEFEKLLYEVVSPKVRELDQCYGSIWPESVKKELVVYRDNVFCRLDELKLHKEMRF